MPKTAKTPGSVIQKFIDDFKLDTAAVADALKVKSLQSVISGKEGISVDLALRLAKFFGTTPDFWIKLQLSASKKALASDIKAISKAKKPKAAKKPAGTRGRKPGSGRKAAADKKPAGTRGRKPAAGKKTVAAAKKPATRGRKPAAAKKTAKPAAEKKPRAPRTPKAPKEKTAVIVRKPRAPRKSPVSQSIFDSPAPEPSFDPTPDTNESSGLF